MGIDVDMTLPLSYKTDYIPHLPCWHMEADPAVQRSATYPPDPELPRPFFEL